MTNDDAAQSVLRAREEVAAAFAILLDPSTRSESAEVHLLAAWGLLHRSVTGIKSAAHEERLIHWIRTSAAPRSDDARARAASIVGGMARDASKPLFDRASSRSRRALTRHARELNRTIDHYEPGQRAQKATRKALLWRWAKVAAVLALFVGFVVTIRGTQDVGSGPWRAHFFPTRTFEHQPILQRHDDIDFEWGRKGPHERISGDDFSVRWDTCMLLHDPSKVIFALQSDDGSRLFVDGELVANLWAGGALRRGAGEVDLSAGAHHIRLEYFELSGLARINLRASLNGQKPAPIPTAMLRYPGDTFDDENPCASVAR